jgi:hypothetical protein
VKSGSAGKQETGGEYNPFLYYDSTIIQQKRPFYSSIIPVNKECLGTLQDECRKKITTAVSGFPRFRNK